MKKLTFLLLLVNFYGFSQVGVGTTLPDATLDVVATNPTGASTNVDGILIPRVDRQRAQSMTGTIASTMIFVNSIATGSAAGTAINITSTGFYYYDGSVWQKIATGSSTDWALAGNGSTSPGTNFIGTTDAVDVRIKTGGNDRWNISDANNGQLQSYSLGTITAPVYSFQGNQNTGMFSSGSNNLGFVTNGTEKLRIPNADQIHAMSLGTAGLPFYSFNGQSSTGMFGIATDNLGFSTAGTEKVRIESDGDVGIGVTPDISAKLDVSATDKGFLAPRVALTSTILPGPITVPATGLFVYNTATAGTIPNNVLPGYYYNSGTTVAPVWKRFSAGNGDGWLTTGNSGTIAGTNYIGTNDVQDLVVKTSAVVNTPLEKMRVTTAGNVGINAPAPTATALLTITPNTNAIRSGIDMTLTNATSTATGLNISTGNSFVNGITVNHSSSAVSASLYGIGGILSSTNIVSGYNGYRSGSGLSYGLYGINGTNSLYATNASTWAGFLQGRTVISSEAAPTSPLGTDLEVRNTTVGAAAPATVSLRQTTALATTGNVLGNLNFGDNYVTTPQAQIQVLRDAASGSAADMPTAMTFSTTPDASAALTERMRITNAGDVGIGVTPDASAKLDVSSGSKGFLAPRVALTATNAAGPISLPATGLFVYNTATAGTIPNNVVPGYYYNSGTTAAPVWKRFSAGNGDGWQTTGNAGTTGANYAGTSDAVDFKLATNGTERMRILNTTGQVVVNRTLAPQTYDRFSVYNTTASDNAIAAYTTLNGWGVYGENTGTGYGVYGFNNSTGYAVRGRNNGSGLGVYGTSATGTGNTNAGVAGIADSIGGVGVFGGSAGSTGLTTNSFGVWGNVTGNYGLGVFGQSTTGANGTGVFGNSTGANGTGVIGVGNGTGNSDGVYGESTVNARYGVWGVNNNATTGYGVRGTSTSPTSYGVYGSATGTTSYGVYGTSVGTNGYGVYGIQTQPGRYGVYGVNNNNTGIGVYGTTTGNGATAFGVNGVTTGSDATGVVGSSVGTNADGVYGQATGATGYGVWGLNNNNTGNGTVGSSTGGLGNGVLGVATGASGYGVYGSASGATGYGVYGINDNATGYAVVGSTLGATGRGIYGTTTGSDATAVYGASTGANADGVYGEATGATGYGVWGVNNNASGIGTVGNSSGTNGFGVFGVASGTSGVGVAGQATTATNAAISGRNLDTAGTGLIASGNNAGGVYIPAGSGGAFNGSPYGTVSWATNTATGIGVAGAGNGEPITTLGATGAGGAFTGNQWALTGVASITGAGNDGTDRGVLIGNYVSGGSTIDDVYVGARIANVNYKILGTGGGSVSTTMKTSQGERILFAPEATENWFFDMGEVELVNGKATVTLDPIFVETLSDSKPFKVFVQGGENTLGSIRITRNQSDKSFVVEDLGGASNGIVQYSIYGIWKGKENLRLPELKPEDRPKQVVIENKHINSDLTSSIVQKSNVLQKTSANKPKTIQSKAKTIEPESIISPRNSESVKNNIEETSKPVSITNNVASPQKEEIEKGRKQ